MFFNDLVKTDGKTLISCRDGIQEYLGSEIGLDDNIVYKVFRSADTIKNFDLVGVPITNDHVDPDEPYMSLGSVIGSEIINAKDESIKKTIEVKNQVKVCKDLLKVINDGKNELSLGYEAKITDVRDNKELDYDFTQSDIIPNHLAVVDKGRCGDNCKFNDKNGVKNMDIKTYQEAKDAFISILSLMPTLDMEEQESMKSKMAKAGEKEETDEEMKARKKKEADMEAEAAEKKKEEDMEAEGKKEESKTQKDEANKKLIDDHISIIAKATDLGCLDAKYIFAGKTANKIMADCIKTQNDSTFADSELSAAFKMLRKVTNPHANFGNGGDDAVFKDKEVK
jgi:hypothetical protein